MVQYQSYKQISNDKVEPERYINLAIIDCIKSKSLVLESGKDLNTALLSFSYLVDTLQSILIANNRINKLKDLRDKKSEYNIELLEYYSEVDKEEINSIQKMAKKSNFRFQMLLERAFEQKVKQEQFKIRNIDVENAYLEPIENDPDSST
jgi:predicted AlkP superfamily phosphohydrolase/phosphomutase|tara:strand:+ start:13991 stop:14440 length:450 start_codon:yes stop_codon:yes gene_type:complete